MALAHVSLVLKWCSKLRNCSYSDNDLSVMFGEEGCWKIKYTLNCEVDVLDFRVSWQLRLMRMIYRLDLDSGNEHDDGISLCFIYLDSWKQKNNWEFFFCVLSTASELTLFLYVLGFFFVLPCIGILKVHTTLILNYPLVYYLYEML